MISLGEGRIRTARRFQAWEGGGEYNVARGLLRCFGIKTAVVTAFVSSLGHIGIHPHHFVKGRLILARDLPESGQTGKGAETLALPGLVFVGFDHHARAGTNDAHIAAEDVNELGKFVES